MPANKQRAIKERCKRKRKGFRGTRYQTDASGVRENLCSRLLGPLQGGSSTTKEAAAANESSLNYIVDGKNVSHLCITNC